MTFPQIEQSNDAWPRTASSGYALPQLEQTSLPGELDAIFVLSRGAIYRTGRGPPASPLGLTHAFTHAA